ncbi:efflux RND transporter periplasmic adaptor subunit [Gynuella sp.]|uniref:efflux RND transporter periplasmic adaptor subunit n=1 Tax=Gynuella sp. TaxID=2969146 RepID=UPI003D0ECF8A
MKPVVYKFAIPLTVILVGVLVVFWLNQTASTAKRVTSSNATTVVAPELTDAQKAKLEKMTPEEQKAFLAKLQQQNNESSQTKRGSGFSGRGGRFGATTSATVETMTIWPDSWSAQLILFGKTFSYQQRNILSRLSSEVTQLEVNAGQRVKAGQLLLKLDDDDLQRSLKQAQNQLSSIDAQIRLQKLQAEADQKSLQIEEKLLAIQAASVKRYENLNNLQLSSSNDYEATLMAYQNQLKSVQSQQLAVARQADEMAQLITQKNEQQLAVEELQSQLKDATIEAPFDGVIASIAVTLGDEISQGEPLITIYDDSLLGLETKIPVNQLRGLNSANQQIYAFTDLAGQQHNLQLSDLDSLASGGAVAAKFRFITPVTITLGEHQAMTVVLPPQNNVFAVPASSLYENKLVYKVEQQQLVDTVVNVTGQTLIDGNTWYIFDSSDIKAGDQILVTRLPNASRGLKVSVPVKEAS